MNLVFLGNFKPANSTENDLLWTLRNMGHSTMPMQENTSSNAEVLEACRRMEASAMIWVHTHGPDWDSENRQGLLDSLSRMNVRTVSYHLDKYYGLDREPMIGNHPFFKTDFFFGVDGGNQDRYVAQGVNHIYLKAGVCKKSCYLAEWDSNFDFDVVFVGAYQYHREWPYRPQLIDWLRSTYRHRFAKFGNPETTVRGDALNHLYATAKVVVGDSLCLNFNSPQYWSDRVYETCGRGGCLVMPFIEGLQEEFANDRHITYYTFGDFNELKAKIDALLSDAERRDRIRLLAHEFVKEHATYHNRMQVVIDAISSPFKT